MMIEMKKDRRQVLVEKVQTYFENELEEPIGQLKADLIIDFFMKELGPQIYNQALDDALAFIQDKLIDLEGTLYIPD